MTAIEVRGLTRRYSGGFEAVRGVSFDVERGEMFALLGTNGAGKTSTVEVVEGLSRPAEGTVRVLGHDPFTERAVVRPRVGVMLQEGGFPPDLTVSEATKMWAGTLTSPRPVAEALALVDLEHRASVRVKQLSGGERRRLDLALALLGKPEVLFLDEPTTGLDPESRRNTWELIRTLLREGVTVLLTTHYLEEAQELADRLAIMHRGRIVAQGTVSEVVDAYPSRISFVPPSGIPLPVVADADSSGRVTVRTNDLQSTLHELLAWAHSNDVALSGLDARSASLEEAFLAIAEEAA
ncbi:ABC transporter ATP-binding protein [Lentzea jiangxiensis]|uniref:ABC-2 type transport system ATP-binding protein n=1 Tax=Lentzea jiangxiensis TaxID=641025 RepID=A0A1H0UPH0_9PSEU|nr:ABC transporter ATP-binding protein [Lentzea jiangxiensis]SDP68000.1 ABC-2 type transport system ATP-binding protein [Lentzea jiangxiensis]